MVWGSWGLCQWILLAKNRWLQVLSTLPTHLEIKGKMNGKLVGCVTGSCCQKPPWLQVLSTLPTHLEIKGLPFNVGFEYSLFTLTYVLLQGYGEIASEARSKPAQPAVCLLWHREQPGNSPIQAQWHEAGLV
eukprot:1158496-Pelagomonas_calceolata.AAC.1